MQNNGKAFLHSWEPALRAWQRVHIDFAGPFMGHMWLIAVDSYSKWLEVIQMKTTVSSATVSALLTIFSRFGFPETLVSDIGPQFISSEFKRFCSFNKIDHVLTPTYHGSSNGLAVANVKLFKNKMKSLVKTFPKASLIDICLLYTSPSPRDKRQSRMPSSA